MPAAWLAEYNVVVNTTDAQQAAVFAAEEPTAEMQTEEEPAAPATSMSPATRAAPTTLTSPATPAAPTTLMSPAGSRCKKGRGPTRPHVGRSPAVHRYPKRDTSYSSPLDDLKTDRVQVLDPRNVSVGSAFLLDQMVTNDMLLVGEDTNRQFFTPHAYRLLNYLDCDGMVCTQAYASMDVGVSGTSDVCDVLLIATHPDHLRQGNATALLNTLTDYCLGLQCSQMVACVDFSSKASEAFWEKNGFVQGKPRRDVVTFRNVTRMVRNLSQPQTIKQKKVKAALF